jgi:Ca2+-binding RTX toxin-like protein
VGNGIGTLLLDSTSHFTGTVTGFSYGDTIDLAGIDQSKITFTHSESGLLVHYGTGESDYFTITGNYDESGFTEASDGHGGTNLVWSHQAPVIDTTHFVHTHNSDNTDTVTGLTVTGSPTETYTLSAVTDGASDGTYVVPASLDDLTLDQVKTDIGNVTYHPGDTPPVTDRIAFTVTDSFGTSDTVNFIFNEGGTGPVTLTGTSGRDVIFATDNNDTLAGNGGQDQFVFSAAPDTVHTILDFDTTQDKIDLRQFGDINSFHDIAISQQLSDALITLDDHETIVLKNVLATNLHASDFIVTNHGGGTA